MDQAQLSGLEVSPKRDVLVVDDHTSVRMALRFVINGEPDMVVCGEAEDAQPALAMVEELSPDIVIVDIALKSSHGLDLIRDLHIRYPNLRLFVHSAHNEELYAPVCFDLGAYGYMNKGQDVQTIVHAIRTVLDGGVYLSPRELQVFEMLGRGLDIKEIADQLSLDHKTVELYRQRIKVKLGVDSAPAVLRAAVLWWHEASSSS